MPRKDRPSPDLASALARHPLFGRLDRAGQAALADRFELQSAAAGDLLADGQALPTRLGWLLAGEAALQRHSPELQLSLCAGELFGCGALPQTEASAWRVSACGPVQVAWLTAADLAQAQLAQPLLAALLGPAPGKSAGADLPGGDARTGLLTTPLKSLLSGAGSAGRAPVTLPPTASIRDAANLMQAQQVSSVMIVEQGRLLGLLTDRDLRNRVVAPGLDSARPIIDVATLAPLSVDLCKPGFDALLLMARHNIHHLPVLDGQQIVGMITANDLTEQHISSAVYLAGAIHRQTTVGGLVAAAAKVGALQCHLAAARASAYATGHIVTAITDAVTARLLQLGEARFGPPPIDYAWVAAGSQARGEQTAKSDQDNCLVLDDAYDEALHDAYFKDLAGFVNDGLHACGYVYCPGEMMARTDTWRQPQRRWAEYFRRWTDKPDPKALMLTCVFFDLRLVHGRASLLDDLRRDLLAQTRSNRIFLAFMVGNALLHRPPLSLFGGISTVRSGQHRDTIDLKHGGIVPVVDLARIYALAGGHEAVNTHDRLAIAAESQEITAQGAHDLRDALEFIAGLRIRHQAGQMTRGEAVDNFLALTELSHFERSQLKDAFGVVQTLQSVLATRYR
jgi:CBS domain-containing protein